MWVDPNKIKELAAQVLNTKAQPRWGLVVSVDPSGPFIRCNMQPEGVLTGWLPVVHPSAGAGSSDVGVPNVGDQAYLVHDNGEGEHGVAVGFMHNTAAPLPNVPNTPGTGGQPNMQGVPAQPGERIIRAHGSVIRLAANGDIFLQPGSGVVNIDGGLHVNGPVTANGNVTAGAGTGDQVTLQRHQHPTAPQGAPSAPTPGT